MIGGVRAQFSVIIIHLNPEFLLFTRQLLLQKSYLSPHWIQVILCWRSFKFQNNSFKKQTLIVSDVLSGFHPPANDCLEMTKYGSDLLNRSLFASLNPLNSRVRLGMLMIL